MSRPAKIVSTGPSGSDRFSLVSPHSIVTFNHFTFANHWHITTRYPPITIHPCIFIIPRSQQCLTTPHINPYPLLRPMASSQREPRVRTPLRHLVNLPVTNTPCTRRWGHRTVTHSRIEVNQRARARAAGVYLQG